LFAVSTLIAKQSPELLAYPQQVKGTGPKGKHAPDIESGRFDESLTMAARMSMPGRIKAIAVFGLCTFVASPPSVRVSEAGLST
jgi:hypothetical protein